MAHKESIIIFEDRQFKYKGFNNIVAHCDVVVYSNVMRDAYVVVATETNDNPGPSITNAIEKVAEAVYKIPELNGIELSKIKFIERYTSPEETYDLVTFRGSSQSFFDGPSWSRIDKESFEHELR